MPAAGCGKLAGARARRAPLPQVLTLRIENDDAVIAVAVRDVDRSALLGSGIRIRINRNVRRVVQQCAAAVAARLAARRIWRLGARRWTIARAFRPNLQEYLLAVVRPLLHDTIGVASKPDVVLVVGKAAVDAVGQNRRRT